MRGDAPAAPMENAHSIRGDAFECPLVAKRMLHAMRRQRTGGWATLDAPALQALLTDAVERDRGLRDRLMLEARSANADGLPEMQAAVRQASAVTRFLDWGEAAGYGDNLRHLAGLLEQWLRGPHAHHVVELAELAIANAERSLEQIDDSNGEVMPAVQEIVEIHRRACEQTKPDAARLAERLFTLQTEGQRDGWMFGNAKSGRARCRISSNIRMLDAMPNAASAWRTSDAPATRDRCRPERALRQK